jgi:hypothetical protein
MRNLSDALIDLAGRVKRVEDAESDAVVAVSLATYCLDAAEWAVVRAELARGEADQLMGQGY